MLTLGDFAWITLIVIVFTGSSTAYTLSRASDAARLYRIEAKLSLILKHLGLEYKDPTTFEGLSEEVKMLADKPTGKIEAIKLLREQTGLGLKAAKDTVEAYIAKRG